MSAGALAGSLMVHARWRDGGLHDWLVRLQRPPVAQTLIGLTPAQALLRVPLYYSLCSHAQREAGRLALAAAGCFIGPPQPSAELWAECVHEHLWRLLLDWPRLLGMTPLAADFAAWRTSRGKGRQALVDANEKVARVLGEAWRADRDGAARALAAFEEAAAALAADSAYPWGNAGDPALGAGESWVHTARGRLRHRLRVSEGKVLFWQVEAPTDRHFADAKAIVERLPAEFASAAVARHAVERVVLLLDPCVPYSVEIVDA